MYEASIKGATLQIYPVKPELKSAHKIRYFDVGGNVHFFAKAMAAFLNGRGSNVQYPGNFVGAEVDSVISAKFEFVLR